MNYKYLGGGHYEIKLTVYRDCYNGIPPFDNPAAIGLYDSASNLVTTTSAWITTQQSVPNVINSPCLNPPGDVCYEVAVYVFDMVISGPGPHTIVYQRCCRNGTVLNLVNVQGTGATYSAEITDTAIAAINSNPVFNNWPPTFICKDAPFTYDHSAMDYEGDSLVYSLSYPFHGGDVNNPIPNPPQGPPYQTVQFLSPYSVNDPLGGVPMQINPSTGILTATPNAIGQFVYGVTVKEYRNGVYLGETRRDYQINVVTCPQITVASIYSPTFACGSLQADFVNTSYNAATYSWDFGDTTTLNDTSTSFNPSYVYPDTGRYKVTLVAYSAFNPLCNDTAVGDVYMMPEYISDFYYSNQHCSNTIHFADASYGSGGVSSFWSWEFGDGEVSFSPNPDHDYLYPGYYDVTLITSTDSLCTDTAVRQVHILEKPVADFAINLDTCKLEVSTTQHSTNAAAFRWEFSDGTSYYMADAMHRFSDPGSYDIRLIVSSDSLCVDTMDATVNIPSLPIPDFDYQVAICDSTVKFNNLSQFASRYFWEFGDQATSVLESPVHTFSISGTIPVRLTATSSHGCEALLKKDIQLVSFKRADFISAPDSCKGLINFQELSNHAASIYWDFGDGEVSMERNPSHRFKEDGSHVVTMIVNAESACPDSIMIRVEFENPLGERVFIPNSFTPNGDGINDYFEPSIFRPCETYSISIFNRWGQKVFESTDASSVKWDGEFAGELLPGDTYVYLLESSSERTQGIITILR